MKNQFTILSFLICLSHFSWGQQFVKTTTPCNDDLLKKTAGRWINGGNGFNAKISKQQEKEIQNRLDTIHQLMFNIYPAPVAFDAIWFGFTTDQEFGSQLEFDHSPDVRYGDYYTNGIPTVYYSYSAKFCAYHCGRETYEIMRGHPCESGTSITVQMNSLDKFLSGQNLSDAAEIMRIDGRPIKLMPVLQGKWKGYDVYIPEQGSSEKMVLLHRQGVLPYIPVTRKQYLDRCIEYLPQFFDSMMKPSPWVIDKNETEEQIKKMQKIKDDALNHYKDELAATKSAGLLDSPAIIQLPIFDISTSNPIFISAASGGVMLATDNPAYLRKDMPKFIPQLMVFSWWPCRCGADKSLDPYIIIDKDFPIEKLQMMIDR